MLTLPDGSVTSRVTWDTVHQLLRRPARTGETAPFQLVPGIPFQGQGHIFSRLVCLANGGQALTRILLEEYSGTPGVPGRYAWFRDVSIGEAETVLRGWLRGEIPTLDGWTHMERSGQTWRPLDGAGEAASAPPQPHADWPWSLNVGGVRRSDPAWQDIEAELRRLTQEEDSFLVLEQKDPQNPERYWFIQCAVARRGPDQGRCFVEIGAPSPGGPQLWERMAPDVQEAIGYFSAVYNQRKVDAAGFRET